MAASSSSSNLADGRVPGIECFTVAPVSVSANQNPTSSSSGFTDEEILAELQDLGYSLSPDQLMGLKQELDRLVEQDEALELRQEAAYFQSLRNLQSRSPPQSQQQNNGENYLPGISGTARLTPTHYAQNPAAYSPEDFRTLPQYTGNVMSPPMQLTDNNAPIGVPGRYRGSGVAPPVSNWNYRGVEERIFGDFEEIMQLTEDRSKLMRQESERLARQYPKVERMPAEEIEHTGPANFDHNDGTGGIGPGSKSVRFQDLEEKARDDYERRALKDLGQTIRENLPEKDKWKVKVLLSSDEIEKYLKASERVVKGDKLLEPTIRPIVCPEAGSLPYRHDPVKRFELYRKEWEKFPAPGDKKRLDLRWKVREYMLRQDIPKLVKIA